MEPNPCYGARTDQENGMEPNPCYGARTAQENGMEPNPCYGIRTDVTTMTTDDNVIIVANPTL